MKIKIYDCLEKPYKEMDVPEIDNSTTIADFLYYVIYKLDPSSYPISELNSGYYVFLDNKNTYIVANPNFSLMKFLEKHNININDIKLTFNDSYGRGGGAFYRDIAYVSINADEGRHSKTPHIHVSTINRLYTCRFLLDSLNQMKSDSIKFNKIFRSKKDRKLIMKFLSENKEIMIDHYNRAMSGENISLEFTIIEDRFVPEYFYSKDSADKIAKG